MNNKIFAYGGFEVQFHAYVTSALASYQWAAPGTRRPTEAWRRKHAARAGN
jgi:hypothetical protein